MVEPWVPHYPTRPSTASFPGLDARRPEPKNEGLSVPTTRPTRSREARPFGCLSSRFVLPCLKRSTTPPPRRGTRRGGPLPTAPAHDARSRARTRAGDQDDPARARHAGAPSPPPPATRGLDGSSSRPPLAAPFRLVREKNRRDASPPLPPPLLDMRASPSRLALALALALALTASPARAQSMSAQGGMYYPYGSAVGPFYGCGFSRDARPSRPLDPPPTLLT